MQANNSRDLDWWRTQVDPFWEAIQDFNMNIGGQETDQETGLELDLDKTVQIPIFNLDIPIISISRLLNYFYPRLLNENLNCLEVILDEEEEKIVSIRLLLEDSKGNYIKSVPLDKEMFGEIPEKWEDLEVVFESLRSQLMDAMGTELGFIIIYTPAFYGQIRSCIEGIPKTADFLEVLQQTIPIVREIFSQGSLRYYPRLKIVDFIKEVVRYYDGNTLENLIGLLKENFPRLDLLLTVFDPEWVVPLRLVNAGSAWNLKFLTANPLEYVEGEEIKEVSRWMATYFGKESKISKLKLWSISLCNSAIVRILEDAADSSIPTPPSRTELLAGKALEVYKKFEQDWSIYPYPVSQNPLVRMVLRGLGINFNIKKIAYWAFPKLLFELLGFFAGKYGRVGVILADTIEKYPARNLDGNVFQFQSNFLHMVEEIPPDLLKSIQISPEQFKQEGYRNLAKTLLEKVNGAGLNLNRVVIIEREIIRRFIRNIIFDLNSSRPIRLFKLIGTIRRFKNTKKFAEYPKSLIFTVLKNLGNFKVIKHMLNLLVNVHEF